nr:MAG TPA: hypothetical protein [Caudoviricetes sp.]
MVTINNIRQHSTRQYHFQYMVRQHWYYLHAKHHSY